MKANKKFSVGRDHHERLVKIIEKDANFFGKMGIIDYSLLIGIHEKEAKPPKATLKSGLPALDASETLQSELSEVSFGATDFESRRSDVIPFNYKKFYEQNEGGLKSVDGKRIFYIGIIDVFTEYNTAKRVEYVVKSI